MTASCMTAGTVIRTELNGMVMDSEKRSRGLLLKK